MIDKCTDGWIIGAFFLCLLMAIPMALVSLVYGVMLLLLFCLMLIPVGIVYVAQWACEKGRWYGSR